MTTLKSLSIKGGLRETFRDGTSKLAHRPCFGYIQSGDGTLSIHETEAKTVRWIFERYLAGESLGKIADGLAVKGISSPTGNSNWNRQAIDKLLANEKYAGCVLLQKTFTQDGEQVRNSGQASRYLYQNNHQAIISMDEFKAVQGEKLLRAKSPEKALVCEWVMSM